MHPALLLISLGLLGFCIHSVRTKPVDTDANTLMLQEPLQDIFWDDGQKEVTSGDPSVLDSKVKRDLQDEFDTFEKLRSAVEPSKEALTISATYGTVSVDENGQSRDRFGEIFDVDGVQQRSPNTSEKDHHNGNVPNSNINKTNNANEWKNRDDVDGQKLDPDGIVFREISQWEERNYLINANNRTNANPQNLNSDRIVFPDDSATQNRRPRPHSLP